MDLGAGIDEQDDEEQLEGLAELDVGQRLAAFERAHDDAERERHEQRGQAERLGDADPQHQGADDQRHAVLAGAARAPGGLHQQQGDQHGDQQRAEQLVERLEQRGGPVGRRGQVAGRQQRGEGEKGKQVVERDEFLGALGHRAGGADFVSDVDQDRRRRGDHDRGGQPGEQRRQVEPDEHGEGGEEGRAALEQAGDQQARIVAHGAQVERQAEAVEDQAERDVDHGARQVERLVRDEVDPRRPDQQADRHEAGDRGQPGDAVCQVAAQYAGEQQHAEGDLDVVFEGPGGQEFHGLSLPAPGA